MGCEEVWLSCARGGAGGGAEFFAVWDMHVQKSDVEHGRTVDGVDFLNTERAVIQQGGGKDGTTVESMSILLHYTRMLATNLNQRFVCGRWK
jgi:hypothetical protein